MKFATGVVVAALVLGGGGAALAGTGHGGGGHGSPVVSAGGRIFTGPRVFVGPRVLVHRRDFVGLLSWRPGSYTSVDPTITSYYSGPNPVSDAAPPVGHQETPTSPAPPVDGSGLALLSRQPRVLSLHPTVSERMAASRAGARASDGCRG